jgi:hypothetical protein
VRRRFRVSQNSVAVIAIGVPVYLCARGVVSTQSRGHRQHVGEVVDAPFRSPGMIGFVGDAVVVVETTREYEARQYAEVDGRRRGRQDLDAVEETEQQQDDATISALLDHRWANRPRRLLPVHTPNTMVMLLRRGVDAAHIGQFVALDEDGAVTLASGQPPVGVLVDVRGDQVVVQLSGTAAAEVVQAVEGTRPEAQWDVTGRK